MWNVLQRIRGRRRSRTSAPHRFQPDARVVSAAQGDRTVLTNGAQYATLNESGTRIWQLLEQLRSPDDIVRVMCAEYDAPAEAIKRDAEQLLGTLLRLRLIRVNPE